MGRVLEAVLENGTKVPYIMTDNPPMGGMKHTYFSPDKSYVIQFFNNPNIAKYDTNLRARLEAIIGKYNPTLPESIGGAKGNDENSAQYFKNRFCWPLSIVKYPEFGIMCPTYPSKFFFGSDASSYINLKGKDKKSNWFTSKNRKYLYPEELGDFRMMLQMSILLARSIRRMHQAGLAHSDLSNNNVLIDPKSGDCVVIDIDSLVVPGLFPPEVVGTRGYIAPEILETMDLDFKDSKRKFPNTYSDLHSLAVLIYEYLFFRHPLIGPKIYSTESSEKDDLLALGSMATFIEDTVDFSNRPKNLKPTIQDMGHILEKLFLRAFMDGLHCSDERPTAMEWERGLVHTWDLLKECSNPYCEQKWFVFDNIDNPVCPFCGTRLQGQIVRFKFRNEMRGKSGHWFNTSEMNLSHNTPLFKWHIYNNVFPDEKTDRNIQAYVCKYNGRWLLVNQNVNGMISPSGNIVPTGQAIELKDGTVFKTAMGKYGILIEVSVKNI